MPATAFVVCNAETLYPRGMLSSCTWGEDYGGIPKLKTSERRRRAQARGSQGPKRFDRLLVSLAAADTELRPAYSPEVLARAAGLDWSRVPEAATPERGGRMAGARAVAKRQQIANMVAAFEFVVDRGAAGTAFSAARPRLVADLCGGGGHVALPLAALHPEWHVVVVDMKPRSCDMCAKRAALCGLANVSVVCAKIEDYAPPAPPACVLALHACGGASDISMDRALEWRAAYVLAPCCIGKMHFADIPYPRSKGYRALLGSGDFFAIAKAADVSKRDEDGREVESDDEDERAAFVPWTRAQKRSRVCKAFLERDRQLHAEAAGYATAMALMVPRSATPKNDVLVGWPAAAAAAVAAPSPADAPPQGAAEATIAAVSGDIFATGAAAEEAFQAKAGLRSGEQAPRMDNGQQWTMPA